jgi:uncharacterized SAM-binding protein YcdF (DUF218 family)
MFLIKKLLASLILPPTGPILLALFGLWLAQSKSRRWRYGGTTLAATALVALLVLSMPVTGNFLLARLETYPPITPAQLAKAQAIVILGGGTYYDAPEYGGDTIAGASLERVRYGAKLARESGLPLLVTGGAPFGGRPEGELMKAALEAEFGIKVRWVEAVSRDTAENAQLSAPLLKTAGINRIALVSHSSHLPRAVPLFEREGFSVTPAPTIFTRPAGSLLIGFLPGGSLGSSRTALSEYLGKLFNTLTAKS